MSKVVLGRGLGALIPGEATAESGQLQLRQVPLDSIAPNPMQPRHQFDPEGLSELSESLKKDGLLQPLVVRENSTGYIIIAGERRYRAARLAGMTEVPVVVMDEVSDIRMLELALVENIHRENLNPIEAAQAYRRLVNECNLTQNELASRVGKSRAAVANQMRLLTLPETVQTMITSGKLTEGHARALLSLNTEAEMIRLAEQIIADSLSVRQAEQRTGSKRKARRLPRRSRPEVAEMESDLKQRLGTAVRIVQGRKKGRIEIEYYSDDDLGRLWELFRNVNG